MALMSGKVYSNTGAPNNADGVNGDIYMQLDGFKTTYRKEGGAWVAVGSTLGAIPEFVSGVGAPSNSLGTDGQYYRNTANQDIYYKQGGVWNIIGNLDNSSVEQAGIGKYLGTAPNLVTTGSMNDLVIAGEYYVTGSVTNMPPNVGAGYVKVWGLDSNNVAQIMQRTLGSSVFEIHFRQSSSGTFGAWTTTPYPSLATTTLAGIVEKATQAELNNGTADVWPDAATILNGYVQSGTTNGYIKLPEWLGGIIVQWGEGSPDPASDTEPTQGISFSTSFTTLFQVYVSTSVGLADDLCDAWYQTYNLSTTGFNVKRQISISSTISTVTTPRWWAIGK